MAIGGPSNGPTFSNLHWEVPPLLPGLHHQLLHLAAQPPHVGSQFGARGVAEGKEEPRRGKNGAQWENADFF